MVHLLNSSKKNIIALTEKIEYQKRMLQLTPNDVYLKNIIVINERTLEFLKSQKKK
jgi:hypothetical protein